MEKWDLKIFEIIWLARYYALYNQIRYEQFEKFQRRPYETAKINYICGIT